LGQRLPKGPRIFSFDDVYLVGGLEHFFPYIYIYIYIYIGNNHPNWLINIFQRLKPPTSLVLMMFIVLL
jgi:hypothetical protein